MKIIKKYAGFLTYIKSFKFRSMFIRYLIGIGAVALAAFIVYGIISFEVYNNTSKIELARLSEKVLAKTVNIYEILFSDIKKKLYLIKEDDNIKNFINMTSDEIENQFNYAKRSILINQLFYAVVDSNYINSIYLYSFNSDYILSWTEIKPRSQFYDTAWISEYERDGYAFFRARKLPYSNHASDYNTLTYLKEIYSDGELSGVLAVNLDYFAFVNAVNQSFTEQPDSIYIVGADKKIIYSNDLTMINRPIQDYAWLYELERDASANGKAVVMKNRNITAASAISGIDHVLISGVYDEDISSNISSLLSMLVLGGIIGFISSTLLAFIISVWLYNNIIQLITMFPYPLSQNENTIGELQYIGRNIVSMLDQNQKIEYELAEKLTELKKAQSIALQMQINPHFLLNTLQYVNLDIMRELKRDTVATRIVTLLSEILRNNFNTEEYLVDFSHEMEQAKKFMQIMNIRKGAGGNGSGGGGAGGSASGNGNGNASGNGSASASGNASASVGAYNGNNKNNVDIYNVEWIVSPEAACLKTVRFVLQPLLENCVMHGFAAQRSLGAGHANNITVQAECTDKLLRITISDNGSGMDVHELEQLRDQLRETKIKESHHIGLCNVDMRIRLIFGEGYGLTVENGNGFTVILNMPKVKAI